MNSLNPDLFLERLSGSRAGSVAGRLFGGMRPNGF